VNGRRLLRLRPLAEHMEGPFTWPAEELLAAD
jgi:hypothetical protein